MDLKPIVTCYGDKDVYNQFNPELENRLPKEDTEWRRSYGRPPKTVKLKAHFIRLSDSMLVSNIENASSLHKQPFFHLYWTDCQDADEYKNSLKEHITEWQRKLKDRSIVDWMIIQVVSQDSLKGNKPKIQLPRSTVFDKIKSDFGGKNNERIVQLWEPFKESQFTRSVESWQSLVTKLRQLLLVSFNRHLGKFEDRVRLLRERRTEPRWSFTTYFLLHEELSFVFEMLGLFEEALIQYDEIDALLTQLVINSNFGEPLDCINAFLRDCKCCDGVPLAKGPQEFLRQLIKTQEASYVELRNYLFARQCNLLLRLYRPWEIAQRTLDFLHNLVHELAMDTLKISMTKGGASCCVILTVLEVLKACEKKFQQEEMVYSLHFALLYQYARQKLDDVGKLCALMPDMTPSESELQVVCMLLPGIGTTQAEDNPHPDSPAKRLQEALSSKHAFQTLYLELTELAIRIYKNIGRARAAKVLGMDLAQFYVSRGEFERAEPLLLDAYKMYKHERWTLLVTQSLVRLAECQKQLKLRDKYAASCSILACEQSLAAQKRSYYTQELLQVMRETMDSAQAIVVRAEPLLRVEDVQIDLMKGIGSVGECVHVRLRLFSALEEEVTCGRVSFSLQTADLNRAGSLRSSKRIRVASPPVLMENGLSSSALSEEDLSDQPALDGQTTEGEGATNGDTAEVPHPLLPKNDTPLVGKSTEELSVLADDESDCCLQCFNVPLRHGINEYNLTTQLAEPGHYHLKQLCVEIGRLDFVWPQLSLSRESRGFAVVADPPRISWNHDKDLQLLCGLPQQVGLRISVDPGSIADGSVLEITSRNKGVTFQPVQSGVAVIHSSMDKEDAKTSPYSVKVLKAHGDSDITDITVAMVTLPAVGPYARIDLNLIIQAPLEEQSSQEEVTEHKLQFTCKWLSPIVTADLSCLFHRPCTVRHVLHSSGTNRFVQLIVSGINPVDLVISPPELFIKNCSEVKMTPMHKSTEYVIVNNQDMSFLWKIESEEGSPSELECELKTSFSPKQSADGSLCSSEKSTYLYDFRVENSQTLYTISSRVEPSEGSEDLSAGVGCKLHVTFTSLLQLQTPEPSHECPQLLYEVESDTNTWIVYGRNSGVVSIPQAAMATCDVILDVMPLTGGNLALPNIKLMKYVEKDKKVKDVPSKGEENGGENSASEPRKPVNVTKESPVVLPFSCGQVYNRTQAIQVRVLPGNTELILM